MGPALVMPTCLSWQWPGVWECFFEWGGVDSSLALALLRAEGHHVTAFYLQIWFQEDFRNYWDACPWEDDLSYCQAVSARACPRAHTPTGRPLLHCCQVFFIRMILRAGLRPHGRRVEGGAHDGAVLGARGVVQHRGNQGGANTQPRHPLQL